MKRPKKILRFSGDITWAILEPKKIPMQKNNAIANAAFISTFPF